MFHIRALSNIYTYATNQQLHTDIYIYITIHGRASVARATVS